MVAIMILILGFIARNIVTLENPMLIAGLLLVELIILANNRKKIN